MGSKLSTPCIEWKGQNINGYGYRVIKKKFHYVHRLAWEEANGPIPGGLCVLHACDNPSCYNVDHLFLGTRAQNNLDRDRKGRGNRSRQKLTWEDVREIRRLLDAGEKHSVIAQAFGISKPTVSTIKTFRSWAWETSLSEEELERQGYERVVYNGGLFVGYRKSFAPPKFRDETPGFYVEVRFRERIDVPFVVYMVFPNNMVVLPGIHAFKDLEALRVVMAKAMA